MARKGLWRACNLRCQISASTVGNRTEIRSHSLRPWRFAMRITTALAALGVSCLPAISTAADERNCTMRDAAIPSSSITYVLCEQGLLLITADDGAHWKSLRTGEFSGLRALAFRDQNRGLAAGDGGAIIATEDGAKTWTARKTDTTENLTDMQMIGDEGWAVGYDGVILHTAD